MALEATELTWRSRIDLEATLRTRREDIRKVAQARFGSLSPEMEAVIAETEAPAFASISRFCAMRLPMGLTSASAKLALHVPRVGPVLSYA